MSYKISALDSDELAQKTSRDKKAVGRYPKSFKKAVSIAKVNFPVFQQWIEDTLHQQLPDDDIVADYVCELLQSNDSPDIRAIHVQMKDFLGEKELMQFCENLWNALLSAQEDKDGIPAQLINARSKEIDDLERKSPQKAPEKESTVDKKTNYNRTQYNARKRHPSTTNRPYRDRDGPNNRYGSSVDRDRDPRHPEGSSRKGSSEAANNAPKRPQNGLRNIYERPQR